MLTVGVHEAKDGTLRRPRARLDGSAVTEAVGMGQSTNPMRGADLGRLVRRAIVNDDNFGLGKSRAQLRQQYL